MTTNSFPVMCKFTNHIRICLFCKSRETILISENMCVDAKVTGIFGSCGVTASKTSEISQKCWKCKDDVEEI